MTRIQICRVDLKKASFAKVKGFIHLAVASGNLKEPILAVLYFEDLTLALEE